MTNDEMIEKHGVLPPVAIGKVDDICRDSSDTVLLWCYLCQDDVPHSVGTAQDQSGGYYHAYIHRTADHEVRHDKAIIDLQLKAKEEAEVINKMLDIREDSPVEPNHYTELTISPLEYIMANEGEFTWCIANVIKYVSRYTRKSGIEDLKRAQWYLNRQIEELTQTHHNQ